MSLSKYHLFVQAKAYRDRKPLFQKIQPLTKFTYDESKAMCTWILDYCHRAICIRYNMAGHTTHEHPILKQLKYQN